MANKYPELKGMTTSSLFELVGEIKEILKSRGKLISNSDLIFHSSTKQKHGKTLQNKYRFEKGIKRIIENPYTHPIGRSNKKSILIDFLKEDWSFLFKNANSENRIYYVYIHYDKRTNGLTFSKENEFMHIKGLPFYVGKGTGDRYKSMSARNRSHQKRVEFLKGVGFKEEEMFYILKDNLTEVEAFELEAKLITFFGCYGEIPNDCVYFTNIKGGLLLNSDISKRPEWVDVLVDRIIGKIKTA